MPPYCLYLSRLTNDLVAHDITWLVVHAKLRSGIPKFKVKSCEDLGEHVTTFQLWCSFNLFNHDYVCLQLFQCTLMGTAVKWYIEFPIGTYRTFNNIAMDFLNHFQLPMRYDFRTELLSTF